MRTPSDIGFKRTFCMGATISKTQIDRLGDRLRENPLSEADLKMLDEYRISFNEAYEKVVRVIREKLNLESSGRPAKSTSSIIEKLFRESIRLSQVQDIAGCRVVAADIKRQDNVVILLREIFPSASVVDRRKHSSYGYRSVHIVIKILGKLIEVQVRTELQHSWAEFSEKLSDKIDSSIKYGGGSKEIQKLLCDIADLIEDYEKQETIILTLSTNNIQGELRKKMVDIKKRIADHINQHSKLFS